MAGLSITRRVGDSFTIGDDITVRVTGVDGRSVRLQIEAPHTMRIHRHEHYGPQGQPEGEPDGA